MTKFIREPTALDWDKVGFDYIHTNGYLKYVWQNGKWDEGELVKSFLLDVHISSTALNYGQACFEGLKALRCRDGKIRLFRPRDNAIRMQNSAAMAAMVAPSEDLFIKAVKRIVAENCEYVPPYGCKGSLYIRPLLIGTGPMLNVNPSPEFTFIVFAGPIGFMYEPRGMPALVVDNFDRAAPRGTGHCKLAGNYAPCMPVAREAGLAGYPITLFLDAASREFVEEFSTSNLIAIKNGKQPTLTTPDSTTILPSITRWSLCKIAESLGWCVESRPIKFSEIENNSFDEIAACGTAALITPIIKFHRAGKDFVVGKGDVALGPSLTKLYNELKAIQTGDIEDGFGWTMDVFD